MDNAMAISGRELTSVDFNILNVFPKMVYK